MEETTINNTNNNNTTSYNDVVLEDIYVILDTCQNNHGIPIGDYEQYHTYCTNKLYRLRHNKAIKNKLVHNIKYAKNNNTTSTSTSDTTTTTTTTTTASSIRHHKQKQHAYYSRKNEENSNEITHVNELLVLFFQAERCWAHACALQKTTNKKNNNTKKNVHGHVQRRLNKAKKFANEFLEKVLLSCNNNNNNCTTQTTIDEVKSYTAWMNGNCSLEHKDYMNAYKYYKDSIVQLQLLINNNNKTNTSPQALTRCDIWTVRIDTILRPLLRYCQYEVKDQLLTSDDLLLVEETTTATTESNNKQKDNNSKSSSINIHFRGQIVSLDTDPAYQSIAVLYLKMEKPLKQVASNNNNSNSNNKENDIEKVAIQLISDLDDTIQLVNGIIQQYDTSSSTTTTTTTTTAAGPAITAKLNELHALKGYFEYQKRLIWSYQQEQHINTDNNHIDAVNIYDALQQNALSMVDLCTSSSNNNNDDDDDDKYRLEGQAYVLRYRAIRCYHLAHVYYYYYDSNSSNKKKALALIGQSQKLTKRAMEEIAACDDDDDDDENNIMDKLLENMENLLKQLNIFKIQVYTSEYLIHNGTLPKSSTNNRPLWMRLYDGNDYSTTILPNTNIIQPIPIPCKGIFYDIAGQQLLLSSINDITQYIINENDDPTEIIQKQQQQQTSSGGFFSSWFG